MIRQTEWDAAIALTSWKEHIKYPVLCGRNDAGQHIKAFHCPCKGLLTSAVHGPKQAQGAATSNSTVDSSGKRRSSRTANPFQSHLPLIVTNTEAEILWSHI
jgi:hypothetical protein